MNTNVEGYKVRKWFEFFEESASNEMGVEADGEPIAKFVVGVVIQNPYANKFSQDLSLLTEHSSRLGDAFGKRLIRVANGTLSRAMVNHASLVLMANMSTVMRA